MREGGAGAACIFDSGDDCLITPAESVLIMEEAKPFNTSRLITSTLI